MKPWIGFDLDGTLAEYTEWLGASHIGKPIPRMVELVKKLEKAGYGIKIFTARVSSENPAKEESYKAIVKWCYDVFGKPFEITAEKDYGMVRLYDDRCIQVKENTGEILTPVFSFEFPHKESVMFYAFEALDEEKLEFIKELNNAPSQKDRAIDFIKKMGWSWK